MKTVLAFSPCPRNCRSAIGPAHAQANKRTSKVARASFCRADQRDATQPKYRGVIQEINLEELNNKPAGIRAPPPRKDSTPCSSIQDLSKLVRRDKNR